MRIDAHVHLWSLARGDYGWLTPDLEPLYRDFGLEDLVPLLDAAGIDAAVLVQAAPTVAETEHLLGIARASDRVAGVVGWVDLESREAPDVLARLASDPKLVGIRPMIQDIPDLDWMLRRAIEPALRALVDFDLTFDALVRPEHLENLRALVTRWPDLRVVVDHAAKPDVAGGVLEPWATDVERLARDTTAFCKLSGLVTEAGPAWTVDTLRPWVEHLLEHFGPDRLLLGSDWPVVTLAASYGAWHRAALDLLGGLGAEGRRAVLGASAVRVYGLARRGSASLRKDS